MILSRVFHTLHLALLPQLGILDFVHFLACQLAGWRDWSLTVHPYWSRITFVNAVDNPACGVKFVDEGKSLQNYDTWHGEVTEKSKWTRLTLPSASCQIEPMGGSSQGMGIRFGMARSQNAIFMIWKREANNLSWIVTWIFLTTS